MSKRKDAQASKTKSAFADILKAHGEQQGVEPSAILPTSPIATLIRKPGKSADPDFVKLTCYVRKETLREAKKKLLDQGREVSEIVEELLAKWLK